MVRMQHTVFHHASAAEPPSPKLGSLQQFVPHECDTSEMGASRFRWVEGPGGGLEAGGVVRAVGSALRPACIGRPPPVCGAACFAAPQTSPPFLPSTPTYRPQRVRRAAHRHL